MTQLRTLLFLLACVAATATGAQKDPGDVTEVQIAAYKANAQKACIDGGKKQGDADERVNAFCSCMITVLNKNLTPSEWRQVVAFSRDNRPEEELKVLAPSLKQLEVCKPQPPAAAPSTGTAPGAAPTPGSRGLSGGRDSSGTGLTPRGQGSQGLR
jgi:hypothetical protein